MFIGATAPYYSLLHTPRFSLDNEEEELDSNISTFNTSIGCSSDQDFPEELLYCCDSPKKSQQAPQAPQAQHDSLAFRPRTAKPSHIPPHSSPAGLIHKGCLSNNMSYSIKGLGVAQSCPQAMFRPVIQAYPIPHRAKSGSSLGYLHASPFIEHIDITTTWKGLLLSDAEQLLYLHRAFKDSLEDVLADAINNMHKELQQQYASYHKSDVGVLVKPSLNRQLSFSLHHLILSMSQRLELCGKLLEKGSTRDFRMIIPLYLSSCDCLLGFEGDGVGDATVEVCVQHRDPLTHTVSLGPVHQAAWISDMLSFNEIRKVQREGQELIIIPRYCGNAAFTANITRTSVGFSIESSQPWLSWDQSISGFRGQVPLYSEMGGRRMKGSGKVYGVPPDGSYATIKALRIEIKASLTAGYGSSIRLERTIRARLTFKIIPWYAHDSACAPTDDLVRPFSFRYHECDSPAPSSRSSRLHGEVGHQSPLSDILYKGPNPSLSSRISSPSSTKYLPGAMDLQSPVSSSRKRRTTSCLEVPSPTKRQRENDTEASSALEAKSSDGQGIPPRKNSVDEHTINEISQPKGAQVEELCNLKSRISSETWTGSSPKPASSDDVLDTLSSGTSRNSSILTEIIIENPDVDPRIRHEQAILWRLLSLKEKSGKHDEETMCAHELKDMYAAMKLSAVEEEKREMAKLGLDDVLDDVFIASSSDMDGSDGLSPPQGTSEPSDGVQSGLGCSDQELAANDGSESGSGCSDQEVAVHNAREALVGDRSG